MIPRAAGCGKQKRRRWRRQRRQVSKEAAGMKRNKNPGQIFKGLSGLCLSCNFFGNEEDGGTRGARCNSAAEDALIFAIFAQISSLRYITGPASFVSQGDCGSLGGGRGSGRTCRQTRIWKERCIHRRTLATSFLPATAAK